MSKELKIKVLVREATTKDGRKFNYFKVVEKNGKLRTLKFTKQVARTPERDCYITVWPEDINLQTNVEYPCYWVREIEEIIYPETSKVDVASLFED